MRSICLYFQIHQPFRLRTYRFFDIGNDSNYYDEYQNRFIIRRVAEKCYLPANKLLLTLIRRHGQAFRVCFSISGTAIEQFEKYTPEVLDSFKQLAATGQVEFLAETYGHSLAGLKNKEEFKRQILMHSQRVEELFGIKPTSFRNTELIYSDEIGATIAEMGFYSILAEGAKHILGWRSPNYLYYNALNPRLRVLLRNFRLSDDIGFRFSNKAWSEWPLTAEKYVSWLNAFDPNQELVNIFLDYETFGEHHWKETGIFEFLEALPKTILTQSNFEFHTPTEIASLHQPVAPIHVPHATSWADEERDLTAWLGNELQEEAVSNLYALVSKVYACDDPSIWKDWLYLQTSDHFYYMCTKWFSDGEVHKYFNPYPSPYEAYINYMNVLSDFIIRVEKNSVGKLEYEGWPSLKSVYEFNNISGPPLPFVTQAPHFVRSDKNSSKLMAQPSDLIHFSDRKLKSALKNTDSEFIAKIIANSAEEVTDKILRNLTKQRGEEVKELAHEIKKVSKKALSEAVEEILLHIQK